MALSTASPTARLPATPTIHPTVLHVAHHGHAYAIDLGHFLTSAGFGGVAALAAGILAYLAARRKASADAKIAADALQQARDELQSHEQVAADQLAAAAQALDAQMQASREQLEHQKDALRHQAAADRDGLEQQREQERARQWWQAMNWAYDRATAPDLDRRLPPEATVGMFDRLSAEAHTDVEHQIVLGLLTIFEADDQANDQARERP